MIARMLLQKPNSIVGDRRSTVIARLWLRQPLTVQFVAVSTSAPSVPRRMALGSTPDTCEVISLPLM